MKAADIEIGRHYKARVGRSLATVRVLGIRQVAQFVPGGLQTVYDVVNLRTGRKTTFRSPQRFRFEVIPCPAP